MNATDFVSCPRCNKRLKAPSSQAGRMIRCSCGQQLRVGAPQESVGAEQSDSQIGFLAGVALAGVAVVGLLSAAVGGVWLVTRDRNNGLDSNNDTTQVQRSTDPLTRPTDRSSAPPKTAHEPPLPESDSKPPSAPITTSHWIVDDPQLKLHTGPFEDKSIEVNDGPFSKRPYSVQPAPGRQLAVFEVRFQPTAADPMALDTLSARRQEAFGTVGDEVLKFLRGDGSLSSAVRNKLPGEYRLFDMERLALRDSSGADHRPIWCAGPEGGLTVIYKRGADVDFHDKWQLVEPESLPLPGQLAVRTNAHRGLKTSGRFLRLVEVGRAINATIVFELPISVKTDVLSLIVDGGKPINVRMMK